MGRPYTIQFDTYSVTLCQILHIMSGVFMNNNIDTYNVFKAQPKASRIQLWQLMSQVLGKSALQVKNYFFNTWVERVQTEQRKSNQLNHPLFYNLFSDEI
ncbi:Hypothetical_protein [Hexamita inflata]|uniref:Hypothetical_protein n=1 Tax=Hexamita inflata TaxID=28002 RepID=A0AA86Q8P0_9EUKA|nr:Hypothetical protein HINF_LOCUS41960 [Hexamita inflata]CAI9954770.1 Hypothetical protein HINF_LOCUS42415 [Hexamita inflata]